MGQISNGMIMTIIPFFEWCHISRSENLVALAFQEESYYISDPGVIFQNRYSVLHNLLKKYVGRTAFSYEHYICFNYLAILLSYISKNNSRSPLLSSLFIFFILSKFRPNFHEYF